MRSNTQILSQVRGQCLGNELNDEVIYGIQDLELLIERHSQNRYSEEDYKISFYSKELFGVRLEKEEAEGIVYFLFYLLFNFPDRAGHTSMAIKKCYGYDILNGCQFGIEIYFKKDDFTTINLMEGILNNYDIEEYPHLAEVFKEVLRNGLEMSRNFVMKRLGIRL